MGLILLRMFKDYFVLYYSGYKEIPLHAKIITIKDWLIVKTMGSVKIKVTPSIILNWKLTEIPVPVNCDITVTIIIQEKRKRKEKNF